MRRSVSRCVDSLGARQLNVFKVLTRGRFSSAFIWNLAGVGLPLAFALYAIPQLLAGFGGARFGFLTIVWAVIGYFSVFDLGLGRALTRLVSVNIANRSHDIPSLVITAMTAIAALGLLFSIPLILGAPAIVRTFFSDDSGISNELSLSLTIMAASLPMVTSSSAMIGTLEAYGKFGLINRVRVVVGLLNFGVPLLVLGFTRSLVVTTIALVVLRSASTVVYGAAVSAVIGGVPSIRLWSGAHLKELWKFGSWITLSNLISPLMSQLDRLVIGAMLSLAVLPIYSIPGDMANRLSFIPVALVGVLFPAFAKAREEGGGGELQIYRYGNFLMLFGILPLLFSVFCFSREGLRLWIDESFANDSYQLLRWLAIGFMFNALARLPHALLQGGGRPDLTAKIHVIELPIYGLVLWFLLQRYGILGAAIAWTTRMALDFAMMAWAARHVSKETSSTSVAVAVLGVVAVVLSIGASAVDILWLRASLVSVFSVTSLALGFISLRRLEGQGG